MRGRGRGGKSNERERETDVIEREEVRVEKGRKGTKYSKTVKLHNKDEKVSQQIFINIVLYNG